ncbi:hypothetical protein FQR65_LT04373 [Abscondita terminalis]|nr:hypothetical protein FQR65_LT04373 [Abscondita terminalis]
MLQLLVLFICITSINGRFIFDYFGDCVVTPQVCPNTNITYWFYTRATQNKPIQLDLTRPETIKNAGFIPEIPFKIIIHGYTGWKDYSPNTEIRPALFENGEYNVISVDYGPIAKEPCYLFAVKNVKVVANCTAQLIDYLVDVEKISLHRFHVIGFSLGAHVSGTISEYLKSGVLERISGLDPAFPLFWGNNPRGQLDKTDAKFVDVIHTNGMAKGKMETCGHVDFYCNGGSNQPGCDAPDVENVDSCNHARAPAYFAESINTKLGFWGANCSSRRSGTDLNCKLGVMGFHTPNNIRGVYYVTTNSSPKFAMGKPRLS